LAFFPHGRSIVTGSADTTALVWDLTGGAFKKQQNRLADNDQQDLWERLATAKAADAWHAVWALATVPEAAVPLLEKHLQPVPDVRAELVASWLTDLDSESFAVREQATRALAQAGDAVKTALERARATKSTLEVQRRLDALLAKLHPSLASLRTHRALAVLEQIGNADARHLLARLATGSPDARQTREARQSLERLTKR
jgi:hypothetical protein